MCPCFGATWRYRKEWKYVKSNDIKNGC
jgi:hypothetical protein